MKRARDDQIIFKSKKIYIFFKPLELILNRLNHNIAKKNLKKFPRIAVYSFDHIGLRVNLEGRYERESLQIIKEFFRKEGFVGERSIAIDVGANVGNHSIFFADLYESVYAFEPHPMLFKLLKLNCENRSIKAFNYALSDTNGQLTLVQNEINLGESKLSEEYQSNDVVLAVQTRRLDDFFEDCERISLIKIDVEGHEVSVLIGALQTIKKSRPVVIIEQQCLDFNNGSSDALRFLEALDYKFFTVEDRFEYRYDALGRSLYFALSFVFGFQKVIRSRSFFPARFYETIIAVPRDRNQIKNIRSG